MEKDSNDKSAKETPKPNSSEKKDIWKPLRDLGIVIINDTDKMVGKTSITTLNKSSKNSGDKKNSQ